MYVCLCKGISDDDVRKLGEWGVTQPADLIAVLELDDAACCGRCVSEVDRFVEMACEARARYCRGSASGRVVLTGAAAAIL
jgi:bacterioferritin-associated ferredoxin